MSQQQKAQRFRDLHEAAFPVANPWDPGSARILEGLGFPALATSSAGFAQTLGRGDGKVTLAEKLGHCRAVCEVTSVPVTVDFENGFGATPADVAAAVTELAGTGVVGCSIEDFDGSRIYPLDEALARLEAAVTAVRALDFPFTLTARAENLLRGVDDLDDTIRRLQAYQQAGADVLYAPGLRTLEQVRQVCAAVSRPVNVLAPFLPGESMASLAEAGARRISIGGAFALLAFAPVVRASRELLDDGTFGWLAGLREAGPIREFLQ